MDIGLGLTLLTAVLWAGVAAGYGAAARRGLAMAPFVAVAASFGALLSVSCTVHWAALPAWRGAGLVVVFIAMSGAAGQTGMLFNGAAMTAAPRQGAATWTLFQMAMIVPFFVSNLSGREHAVWYKWLALPLILAALRGLTPDGNDRKDAAMNRRVWFGLIFAAIACAGVAQTLAQEISLRGLHDAVNVRPTVSLAAGAIVLWVVSFLRREYPAPGHWLLGAFTGFVVAAGNVTLFGALDICAAIGRAYLVFPMAVGGSVLLFAVYQALRGHERCDARKTIGLAFGLAGIALLGLP